MVRIKKVTTRAPGGVPSGAVDGAPAGEIHEVSIGDLVLDPRVQPRGGIQAAVVKRYATAYQAEAPLPPIKVVVVGGRPLVVDGFHRVEALRSLGKARTMIMVLPRMTLAEALWVAGKANLEHGLPLKPREVREVFKRYIAAGQHRVSVGHRRGRLKSCEEMSLDLSGNVSRWTIRRWLQADYPKLFRELGGDAGGRREFEPEGEPVGGPEGASVERIKAMIVNIRQSLWGIEEGCLRGAVIEELEGLVREAKEAREWAPSEF